MRIGRNQMCPCGSGKKFKKCCLGKAPAGAKAPQAAPAGQPRRISLHNEIEKTQNAALQGKVLLHEIGVFIFFATPAGDSWMLEVSEMDGLLLSEGGEKKEVKLVERPDTLEIDWTHRFSIREKLFTTVAYKDQEERTHQDYPCQAIHAAVQRIRRRYPREVLDSIHLEETPAADTPA